MLSLQANSARDSLAKSLYIRTIVAVTRRINTLLKGAGANSPQKSHNRRHTPSQFPPDPIQNEVRMYCHKHLVCAYLYGMIICTVHMYHLMYE